MQQTQHLIWTAARWALSKRAFLILVLLLIGLRFSTSHYFEIPSRGIALDSIQGTGLYPLEEDEGNLFRWTNGDFRAILPGRYADGTLHLRMYFPETSGPTATVGLNEYTATITPRPGIRALKMFIPNQGSPHQPTILSIKSGFSQLPGDDRALGVSMLGLSLLSFDKVNVISWLERLIIGLIALQILLMLGVRWRSNAAALMDMIKGFMAVEQADPRPFFRLAVLASILIQIPIYGQNTAPSSYINAVYFTALALIFIAVSLHGRIGTLLLMAGVVLMGVELRVYWTNVPTASDVYWANTQAISLFLEGRNPYSAVFTWVTIHPRYAWYGYLPLSIISQLPFYLLGDIRWGLAVFDLASIGLLYLMTRRSLGADKAAAVAAFLLLYTPLSEYTLIAGIVDPVMMFWMIASIYLLSHSRWHLAAVAAGLAIASKQYGAIYGLALLPYLIHHKQWRAIALLVAIPAVAIAPYALWSFPDFLEDTLLLHLRFPPLPEPFKGVWNTSLPAQWVGLTNQNVHVVKAVARYMTLICLAVVIIRNIFRPTLKQVVSTTMAALTVLFLWNGALTQSFYWRNIVLLLAALIGTWSAQAAWPAADQSRPLSG